MGGVSGWCHGVVLVGGVSGCRCWWVVSVGGGSGWCHWVVSVGSDSGAGQRRTTRRGR